MDRDRRSWLGLIALSGLFLAGALLERSRGGVERHYLALGLVLVGPFARLVLAARGRARPGLASLGVAVAAFSGLVSHPFAGFGLILAGLAGLVGSALARDEEALPATRAEESLVVGLALVAVLVFALLGATTPVVLIFAFAALEAWGPGATRTTEDVTRRAAVFAAIGGGAALRGYDAPASFVDPAAALLAVALFEVFAVGPVEGGRALARSLLPVAAIVVVFAFVWQHGPLDIGSRPAAHSDEFVIYEVPLSILEERGSPAWGHFNSRPETEQVLGGAGRLEIVIGVGYDYLLAAWTLLVGEGLTRGRLFSLVCSVVALGCLFRLAWGVSGRVWAGALVALFWALDASIAEASRTLRLDVPTAATYLAAAWVGLELGTRGWAQVVCGALLGLGATMHPVGVVAAPAVLLFAERGRDRSQPLWRTAGRLALGALIPVGLYVGWIVLRRDAVRSMLALHAIHRQLEPLGLLERFAAFVAHQSSAGPIRNVVAGWHEALLGTGLVVCLALGARARRRGEDDVLTHAAISAFAALALLPVLGRDHESYRYWASVWPWVFIAGVAGLERLVAGASGRFARAGVVALPAIFLAYGAVALRAYATMPPEREVASYDALASALAREVAPGSWLVGTPDALPIARRSRSIYLHAQVIPQFVPPYASYPVTAVHEGYHLKELRFDRAVLERLRATGRRLYFHLDMADWFWNCHAPFGRRYGASFGRLREELARDWRRVTLAYSQPRGRIELWEYRGAPDAPEPVIVEGRRVSRGPPVEPASGPGALPWRVPSADGVTTPVARYRVTPGVEYWLEAFVRLEGDAAGVLGVASEEARWALDARELVPVDWVFKAEADTVDVWWRGRTGSGGTAVLETVALRAVMPAR